MEKSKIILKRTLMFSVLVLSMVVLSSSSGGGKGGGKDRNKKGPSTGSCTVIEKPMNLVLYPNFPTPSIRNTSWTVPIMHPSIWNGDTSATSLYDNPYSRYYCLITVATECSNWSGAVGGIKTYVWNSTNGSTMSIGVPSNRPFRVSVEYYEPCGPYWIGSNPYGRGKWYSESNMNYQTYFHMTQWFFVKKENC